MLSTCKADRILITHVLALLLILILTVICGQCWIFIKVLRGKLKVLLNKTQRVPTLLDFTASRILSGSRVKPVHSFIMSPQLEECLSNHLFWRHCMFWLWIPEVITDLLHRIVVKLTQYIDFLYLNKGCQSFDLGIVWVREMANTALIFT